jgi:UDP-N-acetylglucosamine--N-acetylmuramyl-(pentapeptide) pyrophosphoryl-undecaprenol N-acetylglucosamine transferase
VLHIAGRRDFGALRAPAADLAVARAGGSIFELAQYGLPALLVPYPHATADHQTANARWMQDAGAALAITDAELTPERLRAAVDALLLDPDRLAAMAAASARLARPDAARDVARAVLAAARGQGPASRPEGAP